MSRDRAAIPPQWPALMGAVAVLLSGSPAWGDGTSGRLRLTGGVAALEGAAGGGLAPWALIGGLGTRDQIGAYAFASHARTHDLHLRAEGVGVGFYDRVELSLAQQHLRTGPVGEALGLGAAFTPSQTIVGIKLRLAGNAVLDQDSVSPQISVGALVKRAGQRAALRGLGVNDATGVDGYLSASKLWLAPGVLVNATLLLSRSNQTGLLGFGKASNDRTRASLAGSVAYMARHDVLMGVEWRGKRAQGKLREDPWASAFVAYAPSKNITMTAAWVDLGRIVTDTQQRGAYGQIQVGF